jgi:hypothetical protein
LSSFVTSWIPTAGAAVTRAADICNVSPLGSWFTPNAFSYALEWFMQSPMPGANGGVSDNSFGENTWYLSSGYACNKIGTNAGTAAAGGPALGVVNKQCGTFNVTGLKTVTNGGAVGIYNAALVPPGGAIRLAIADSPWSQGGGLNGHARNARFWPRVLSDFEMQSVTR